MEKPTLYVIAGPNGSGKTTITEQLLKHKWGKDCVYINPDNIAQELGSWNDHALSLKAAQIAEKMRIECINNNQNLAFETVFSGDDKLEFIRHAVEKNYFVRIFYISTNSPEINASRVFKRFMNGGHEVPIPKIISRYYKSMQNLIKATEYVDKTYLYDNSIENAQAQLQCRLIGKILEKNYVEKYATWIENILNQVKDS